MPKKIGLIAEDDSDIEVIIEILKKYLLNNDFSTRKFVGNGCGKLRTKCGSWAENLFKSGCDYVFIFHDLDRNHEKELRGKIEAKVCPIKNPNSLVVIPKEELEAWLLSDSTALKNAFKLDKEPKPIANCENIQSPKEHLRDLIYKLNKKRYLNTVHNKKIASEISLDNLRRCRSYASFDSFLIQRVCP